MTYPPGSRENGLCSSPSQSNLLAAGACGSNHAGVVKLETLTPSSSYVGASTGSQISRAYSRCPLPPQNVHDGSAASSSTSCDRIDDTDQSPVSTSAPASSGGLAATMPHWLPSGFSEWKPSTPAGTSAIVSTMATPWAPAGTAAGSV